MKKILPIFLFSLLAACGGDDDDNGTAALTTAAGTENPSGSAAGGTDAAGTPAAGTSGASTGGNSASGADGSGNTGTQAGAQPGTEQDRTFITNAYQLGLGEIELAQLALTRATDEDTRLFAQRMLDNFQYMNEQIAALAQKQGTTLPTTPASDFAVRRQNLENLSGAEFDRAYAAHNVTLHQQMITQVRQLVGTQETSGSGTTGQGTSGAGAGTSTGTGTTAGSSGSGSSAQATAADSGAGASVGTGASASDAGGATATTTTGTGDGTGTAATGGAGAGATGATGATGAGTGASAAAMTEAQTLAANALPVLQLNLLAAKALSGVLDPAVFITNLYQDGLDEIQTSQLALQRTSSDAVRAYAQQMIDEHTSANERLTQYAQANAITLPTEPTEEQRAIAQELALLAGADFDKAYMNHNVLVHEIAVAQTEEHVKRATGNGVAALAATLLPRLQVHLAAANLLYEAIEPSALFTIFQSGAGEVALSQLALQLSDNAQVQEYARRMVTEHSAVNTQAVQLARQAGRELPSEIEAQAARVYVGLSQLTGAEFDRAFIEQNVQLHEQALELIEAAQGSEQNAGIQSFIATTITALRAHLQSARQLETSLPAATTASQPATEPAATEGQAQPAEQT